ncbi:Uncharacterized protein YfiR precursor [Citrobacter freundii]|uniref:Uncharacterized protein YfiR n=1 Tax=Citrobacter freundii TaxID=546 RepID=A0A7G2IWT0_CITFR|nr:Uncharacterized protein YfiR precursor [Citrobacter freundii]
MSYSYRLILLLALLLTGLPLYAQSVTEEAKSVRAMVSGIVSYTRWPALSGPPKLCIFSSSRFFPVFWKIPVLGHYPIFPSSFVRNKKY